LRYVPDSRASSSLVSARVAATPRVPAERPPRPCGSAPVGVSPQGDCSDKPGMHPAVFQGFFTIAVAIALASYVGTRQEKSAPQRLLLLTTVFVLAWCVGGILAATATTKVELERARSLTFLGFSLAPSLWLLLSLRLGRVQFIENSQDGSLIGLGLLVPSLLAYLAFLTNDAHHLYVRDVTLEAALQGPRVWGGPIFFGQALWNYIYILISVLMYWYMATNSSANSPRRRASILPASSCIPGLGHVAYVFGGFSPSYDPTPGLIGITLLLVFVAVVRYQFLETLPLARRDVIEHLPDGVVIADGDGYVLDINPAARLLLGVRAVNFQKQSLVALLLGMLKERQVVTSLEEFLAVKATSTRGLELVTKDHRRIQVYASSIRGRDGEPAGQFVLLRDRTEERRYERLVYQNQKLETVGILAAGLAHEVNNPLAFIHANLMHLHRLGGVVEEHLDRFEEKETDELADFRGIVEETLEGVDRIKKIVGGLRRFTRMPENELVPVDLKTVIHEAITLLGLHRNHAAEVAVEMRLEEPLPSVEGSAERLGQVLLNLLLNAKQALAGRTKGRIRVEARAGETEVEVRVSDNGPGIPPSIQSRIFDPFFTTKGPNEGTGLGLSIAFDIVSEHKGTLEVVSAPGEGATFLIRLPHDGG